MASAIGVSTKQHFAHRKTTLKGPQQHHKISMRLTNANHDGSTVGVIKNRNESHSVFITNGDERCLIGRLNLRGDEEYNDVGSMAHGRR